MNSSSAEKANQHPYNGRRHSITRPDWPTKHNDEPKSRSLLSYILDPGKHSDRILRNTPDVVLVEDKYPKAQVHFLVLPKWQPHRDLHPHDAFEDPDFLAMVRMEAQEGLKLAIPILKTKMQDTLVRNGMSAKEAATVLERRDLTKDFQIGIHAHPSQHELHVHIISRDMVSWHDYGARHYSSFNTPFVVPLNLYPLPRNDIRREVHFQNANLLKQDFQCWRCRKDYGKNWEAMKAHLNEEYVAWILEDTNSTSPSTGAIPQTSS